MSSPGDEQSREPLARCEVVLVSMPFCRTNHPSLGLGLLSASLRRLGIGCEVLYFGLRLAARMGHGLYAEVTRTCCDRLVGEWLFSHALFGSLVLAEQQYVDEVLRDYAPELVQQVLAARRDLVEPFLADCCRQVLARRPRLVGFTSLFQQHVPSLALARRVAAASPETFVVLGGPNCEGVMGAACLRSFPFVDAVVSGDGDVVFPELVCRVLDGTPHDDLPGVYTRASIAPGGANAGLPNAPHPASLDDLPLPDFETFFETHRRLREMAPDTPPPTLLMESSRGCFWGRKHHCTFCGSSPDRLAFRSKSASRAIDELGALAARYPGHDVRMVDNTLDPRHQHDLVPALARERLGPHLFYEVKANLRKSQLRAMRQAGITSVQIGIESFDDEILRRMRKGVAGLKNVAVLKWCTELGIAPHWMLLSGTPGEPTEAYGSMVALLPLLFHLHPPLDAKRIRLERFSPNFEQRDELGLVAVRPLPCYRHIYPLPPTVVFDLAYYFVHGSADHRVPEPYVAPLVAAVEAWRRAYPVAQLVKVHEGAVLRVVDTRPAARQRSHRLVGLERAILLACDDVVRAPALPRLIARLGAGTPAVAAVQTALDGLVSTGLLLRRGDAHLALPIDPFERLLLARDERAARPREMDGGLRAPSDTDRGDGDGLP